MGTNILLKQFVSEAFSLENIELNKFLPDKIINPIKRTKLWELREMHHCPIIGVCLTVNELIKFARRFSFSSSLSDTYLLHIEAIGKSSTRNSVSKAIQKHLDIKYQDMISQFSGAKSDADVRALWEEFYHQGKGASAMWASLTHKMVSEKTQETIYADMHMHSHQVGAGQAADIRKLNRLEIENAEIKEVLEQQQQRHAVVEAKWLQKINKMTKELEIQQQQNSNMVKLQTQINRLESGVAITEMGVRLVVLEGENEQLRKVAERIPVLENALEAACDGAKTLVKERNTLMAERDVLEGLLRTEMTEANDSDKEKIPVGPSLLENNCVLCVGGRVSLFPEYRAIAKQLGISLIHHDGGQQEALSRLPDMVNRASAVICPTDCVSHAAYYLLKRQCKNNSKLCLLFKGASISSFANALTQFSSGQANQRSKAIIKLQ